MSGMILSGFVNPKTQRLSTSLSVIAGLATRNSLLSDPTSPSGRQIFPGTLFPKLSKTLLSSQRAAGISYIWIDSLCIVQDDDLDWETESAKMASIYQNAYLTIAADLCLSIGGPGSDNELNPTDGCFSSVVPTISLVYLSYLTRRLMGGHTRSVSDTSYATSLSFLQLGAGCFRKDGCRADTCGAKITMSSWNARKAQIASAASQRGDSGGCRRLASNGVTMLTMWMPH
jgi:hypothetical protein